MGFDKREAMMGSHGKNVGWKTSPQVPYISGELLDDGSFSLADINSMENSTITLDLANGKQVVLRGAYSTNENGLEVDTDGKISVKFEGASMEEVLAL